MYLICYICIEVFKYGENDDDIVRNGCFALASEHYKIVTDQYFRSLSHHQANAIFSNNIFLIIIFISFNIPGKIPVGSLVVIGQQANRPTTTIVDNLLAASDAVIAPTAPTSATT
ncbi:hypothetical protein T08_5463, partial [Trichinella sp. T8]